MIKSFTAFTNEADDADTAVTDILTQLKLDKENKLLKNTIGIVSCYADYIESGIWASLCEKLPFEIAGVTTIANMTGGEIGETMLCLMVLTSDEICFSTGLSAPINCEDSASFSELYQEALKKLPGKPSLMLSFSPLIKNFSADFYVDIMSEISGNVPNFGSLAVDHNPDYSASQVLLNGKSYLDRFTILLMHGEIKPAFYIGAISDKKLFAEKSVVTASERNLLQSVNGIPVIDFLQSLGLKKDENGTLTGINSFPIIVDYNDGTMPIARTMFAIAPDGSAVCGGNIPTGAALSIGVFDEDEIVATTCRTLGEALKTNKYNTLLMYSCIGRYFSQGYNTMAEFESLLTPLTNSNVSYIAAYSGGELCPVYGKSNESVNRSHNNTFVICAF